MCSEATAHLLVEEFLIAFLLMLDVSLGRVLQAFKEKPGDRAARHQLERFG